MINSTRTADATLGLAVESLGTPAHSGNGYAIYCGDSIELLSKLEPATVDLTITSPPYNIGKEYEELREIGDYIDWCAKWLAQIHAVTADAGTFWLNVGYVSLPDKAKAIPLPYLLWEKIPFFLLQEVVWNYGAGVAARKFFSPRNEKFLWCVKNSSEYTFNLDDVRDPNVKYPNQKKNGKLKCNPLGKNPTDVWSFPKVTSGSNRSSKERTPHPAQFPVAVIDRIVKASSNEGDLILDPFLGSGTTIEAALRNNRVAIGFEIRPDYVDIAVDRIERFLSRRAVEEAQQQLF